MKMEQVFSESDLSELEQVLAKSMEPKSRVMRFWMEHTKVFRCCIFCCIIILFVCCAVFLFAGNTWQALISAIVGIFAFVYNKLWNKLINNFMNLEKMVQKYREPFVVAVEGNTLHYRQSDFLISSIDQIVEYKHFLFIRANKKWCFIKTEEDEKAMFLLRLNGNLNITFNRMEEPADLRQFR